MNAHHMLLTGPADDGVAAAHVVCPREVVRASRALDIEVKVQPAVHGSVLAHLVVNGGRQQARVVGAPTQDDHASLALAHVVRSMAGA